MIDDKILLQVRHRHYHNPNPKIFIFLRRQAKILSDISRRTTSPTRKNTCRAKKTTNNHHQHAKSQLPTDPNMVAGKRVSPQDCARIRAYIDDTTNPRSNAEIANLMGVSTRTIERLRLNFELFDAPYPPRTAKVGRPMNLNEAQQAVRTSTLSF